MRFLLAGLLMMWGAFACSEIGSASNPQIVSQATPIIGPTPTQTATAEPVSPSPTNAPALSATSSITPTVQAVTQPTQTSTPVPTLVPQATPTLIPQVEALRKLEVERAFPNLSFEGMVDMAYPDDGSNRLFVVLQPGRIIVFQNDQSVDSAEEFLDIESRVNDRGREEGLLGLTFDPSFGENGYFYVYYTADDPRRSVISRFNVFASNPNFADDTSERVIMEVPQPFGNHNGGQIAFGPDGYLYIALGDGGSGGDPRGHGQNLSTLLGSILRIDVSTLDSHGSYSIPPDNPFVGSTGARGEIWAYGLRNPWRFSFDTQTGDLWAADVGQNDVEEIDLIKPGLNYGWNIMEGNDCFEPRRNCNQSGLELPVIDYTHRDGCSVTGGYVYRGERVASLSSAYVYGDFCSGKIWALRHDGQQVTEHVELINSNLMISSFGQDQAGEVYILSFDEKIYRFSAN